jgi:HSP20 family protein
VTRTFPEAPVQETNDWAGSPISTIHHPAPDVIVIPVEQYPDGSSYVFRMELPGIDPEHDLQVSVQTGILSVKAFRQDEPPVKHGSEFRYGTYARHVALPAGANVHDVTANCQNGILTVRIGMEPEHDVGPRTVAVEVL